MKIAENVKKLRKNKNLTQVELAEAVGTSQGMINHIENGIKIPSLALALSLAEVLDTTVDAMCKGVI